MKCFKQNEDLSNNLDVYIYFTSLTSKVQVSVKDIFPPFLRKGPCLLNISKTKGDCVLIQTFLLFHSDTN